MNSSNMTNCVDRRNMSVQDELIFSEAEHRYKTDPEFHALVYRAVQMSVPETVNPSINTALQEVATGAASVVLILKEKGIL